MAKRVSQKMRVFASIGSISLIVVQSCRSRWGVNRDVEIQVVGGEGAKLGQFPGINYLPGLGCSASKIAPRHFLTAKHCIENAGAQNSKVLSFSVGEEMSNLKTQSLEIVAIPLHSSSDLAIIKVKIDPLNWPHLNVANKPVQPFAGKVVVVGYGCFDRPVTLPGPSDGWASLNQKTSAPTSVVSQPPGIPKPLVPGLHYVSAMISNLERFVIKISKKSFQKSDQSLLPGLCAGDSGGPLLVDNKGVWEVIGVNSSVHQGTGENTFARIDKQMTSADLGTWLKESMK